MTVPFASAWSQSPASITDTLYAAVDRWVEHGLLRYQIAGASLAIVRNGIVVHQRGFGLADITRGYRVDPDTTVFHVASITKLITAIAALQQVEAGALALHRDIRPMLGPIGADGWNRDSVTLHQLLTHTAGLDTRWIGMAVKRPGQVLPLAAYLARDMPSIINRPGTIVRYSNHGYAAIGRLVEVASGVPWAAYVEERILQPLGMTRSYAQPRERAPGDAVPYRYRSDTLPEPDVHEHVAPGGAMRSTAADIARLMVALLGTTTGKVITRESRALLLAPQHYISAGVAGFAYGAFAFPNGRVKAMSMGGEVPGFSTRLLLVPELALGVVLMVNRKDPTLAVSVFDSVLARVATPSADASACPAGTRHSPLPGQLDGLYRSNVYERESFLRIGALFGPMLSVTSDGTAHPVVLNPIDNFVAGWQPSGDSTWSGPDGRCLSLVQRNGRVMLAINTKMAGPVMLERVRLASNPSVILPIVMAALLTMAVLSARLLWRRFRQHGAPGRGYGDKAAILIVAVSAIHLVFLIMYAAGLYQVALRFDDRFAFGVPMWFSGLLMVPYVALGVTIWLGFRLLQRSGNHWSGWLAVASSCTLLTVFWNWQS